MLPIGKTMRLTESNRIEYFSLYFSNATDCNDLDDDDVKVIDLIRGGFLLKLFGIVVIFLISIVILPSVFHLDDVHLIFNATLSKNVTLE